NKHLHHEFSRGQVIPSLLASRTGLRSASRHQMMFIVWPAAVTGGCYGTSAADTKSPMNGCNSIRIVPYLYTDRTVSSTYTPARVDEKSRSSSIADFSGEIASASTNL